MDMHDTQFNELFNPDFHSQDRYRLVLLDRVEFGLDMLTATVRAESEIMKAGASSWQTLYYDDRIEYLVDELNDDLEEELFASIEKENAA